jgi:putative phosphoribosyl transferase
VRAIEWARASPLVPQLPIGLFGASTGAAAALKAVALLGNTVAAVVSRGGRPDLAGDALLSVRAPSLFIVGGDDPEVETLNRRAQRTMRCESQVSIIPGAGHLFEEGRSLETVAGLAAGWFLQHFEQYQTRNAPPHHPSRSERPGSYP